MHYIRLFSFIILALSSTNGFAQIVKGVVYNAVDSAVLAYVNIGIIGGNLGTVSNEAGRYTLDLSNVRSTDSLRFSYLGFFSQTFHARSFLNKGSFDIYLEEKDYELIETVVYPREYVEKVLGNSNNMALLAAGFKENQGGYECGVLMKVKKSAFLYDLTCYVALCSYDTLFYRMNVYKPLDDGDFEPILEKPIYLTAVSKDVKQWGTLNWDLRKHNIVVDGDFLITLEHVKDLGPGQLFFSAAFIKNPTYYRETSQAEWKKHPVGIGFAVKAKVEK